MNYAILMEEAERNIAKLHRPPRYQPMDAGLAGLAAAGAALAVFMGFARLNSDDFAGAFAITCAIAFGAPYFFVQHEWKSYRSKIYQEYRRLEAAANGGIHDPKSVPDDNLRWARR